MKKNLDYLVCIRQGICDGAVTIHVSQDYSINAYKSPNSDTLPRHDLLVSLFLDGIHQQPFSQFILSFRSVYRIKLFSFSNAYRQRRRV